MTEDRDWIGTALEAGATLDWITPLASMLSNDRRLMYPAAMTAIVRIGLHDAGIKVRREFVRDGVYYGDVKRDQYAAALRAVEAAQAAQVDAGAADDDRSRGVGCGWWLALTVLLTILVVSLIGGF